LALITLSIALGSLFAVLNSCIVAKSGASKPATSAPALDTSQAAKLIYRPAGTAPALWGPGDMYLFLATGAETNGAFFQFEAIVPPGGGPPPHIHRAEDETFYLIEGSLELHLGEKVVMAKAGDFVSFPKGTAHSFKNVGSTTAKMLVTCVPAGLEKYFEEVFPRVEDRTAPPPPVTEELLQKMRQAAPKHNLEFVPPPAGK
jgi:quercetin dioxygenase-like cupin family protein